MMRLRDGLKALDSADRIRATSPKQAMVGRGSWTKSRLADERATHACGRLGAAPTQAPPGATRTLGFASTNLPCPDRFWVNLSLLETRIGIWRLNVRRIVQAIRVRT